MSTWDVPTVTSLKLSAKCPTLFRVTADVVAIPMYATEAVRDLNVNRRKCRFYDESNLKISSSYSVNLCYSQCRVDFAVKKCGCAPFFYEGVVEGIYVVLSCCGEEYNHKIKIKLNLWLTAPMRATPLDFCNCLADDSTTG